jgi:hypothetical protein
MAAAVRAEPLGTEPQFQARLRELERLLGSHDTAALGLVISQEPVLRSALGPALDELNRHLDRFDFEQARRVLLAHLPL